MHPLSVVFDARLSSPHDGHELTGLDGNWRWCIRCGALYVTPAHVGAPGRWEAPSTDGHSRSSVEAPPCRPSTAMGAECQVADARLMLHALTHGWRCEPVLLAAPGRLEGWRWWRVGLLGEVGYGVAGAWVDGPVVDAEVRKQLLETTA